MTAYLGGVMQKYPFYRIQLVTGTFESEILCDLDEAELERRLKKIGRYGRKGRFNLAEAKAILLGEEK